MRSAAFVTILLLLGFGAPALAGDVEDCKGTNPEVGLPACQKLLARPMSKSDKATVTAKVGAFYNQTGKPGLGLEWAGRAIAIDPALHLGYYVRGGAHLHKRQHEPALADFNKAISLKPDYAWSYHYRGLVHRGLGKLDLALQDQSHALKLEPRSAVMLTGRAITFTTRGELDRALADIRVALEIAPNDARVLAYSAVVWARKGDLERARTELQKAQAINPKEKALPEARGYVSMYAEDYQQTIADLSEAIGLDPSSSTAYAGRALAHSYLKQAERARADAAHALQLDARSTAARVAIARVEFDLGNYPAAIQSASQAIDIDPISIMSFKIRADALQKSRTGDRGLADIRKVLSLKARTPIERSAQLAAAQTLNASEPMGGGGEVPAAGPRSSDTQPTKLTPANTRRVALVIANSKYEMIGALPNPANDANLIATTLKDIGFGEVDLRADLNLADMMRALKDFGDKAATADWALIYFAGHGLEMNGTAFLIPVDAKLYRDTHVVDEAVPLDRFIQKTETAKRLRLVILDACRNNPFAARMVRSAGSSTRSIGKGLPAIEVEGDVLVAYATKHGTTALDGEGSNSPYALALARHMPTPNTDVRVMFGKVRDTVRIATQNLQEPYTYGSIGGELHYFVERR